MERLLVILALICLGSVNAHVNCVAHRGASGEYPENTILAFRMAEEQGCEWFEFDTVLSRDDQVIVLHDPTMGRTTNCTGFAANLDYYGHIEYCVAGGSSEAPERVPHFREVLDFMRTSKMNAIIDIKAGEECISAMARDLQSYPDLQNRILLAGQSVNEIEMCKIYAPNSLRSYTCRLLPSDPASLDIVNYNTQFDLLTGNPSFVTRAQANGQTIFGWTLNSETDWARAIAIGVNGVVTDYPSRFIAFRDNSTMIRQ